MNCTDVEALWEALLDGTHDEVAWGAAGLAILVSLLLLAWGRHVVRVAGAIGAAAAAGLATFSWLPIDACDGRLVGAGIAAALAGGLALCLAALARFTLASASAGFLAHSVYTLLPLGGVTPPFVLLGTSGYHLLAIGGGAAVGGVLALVWKSAALRVVSSAAGACSAAVAVILIAGIHETDVPQWALLLTIAGLTPVGVCLQGRCVKKSATHHLDV